MPLDAKTTALVLIDLQNGIVAAPRAPYSSTAVVAVSKKLAAAFRAAGAPVFLVHVGFAPNYSDALKQPVDEPTSRPEGGPPAGFSDLVEGLQQPGDIVILKRNWGAFHGTDLDLHLRRRGITTLVLGGIATNFGVESTARDAWERNYSLVIVEDACTTSTAEAHELVFKYVFPRIAHVVKSADMSLT